MTTGMTKHESKDLTPRGISSPRHAPVMRRSRSLNELPGSVRVPILKRDNERMRARLEAGAQGLAELKLLREQQQKNMDEVRTTASQKKPTSQSQNGRFSQNQSQPIQRRMSTTSLHRSSQSLARISEEGDENGGVFTNGRLQDCTNFNKSQMGHRRHSSFSLEACRNRRPLCRSDSDVYEQELSNGTDVLRKTNSWSSLPASYRSVSNENIHDGYCEPPSQIVANNPINKKNQRSLSFSAIPGNNYVQHFAGKEVGDENIEPKLRRGSIQCEAVLTGSGNKKNLGIFKDINLSNISTDTPSPMHAILHGFKATQGKPLKNSNGRGINGWSTDNPSVSHPFSSRSVQGSLNNLSQSSKEDVKVSHRRAFSETDTLIDMSKGSSLPTNMNIVGTHINNKTGNGYSPMSGRSAQNRSQTNYNGQGSYSRPNRAGFVQMSDTFNNLRGMTNSTHGSSQHSVRRGSTPIAAPSENDDERRKSEGNVFLENNPYPQETWKLSENIKEKMTDLKPARTPSPKTEVPDNFAPSKQSHETELSPGHEKKFSIASDEGYVTSPPSTPIGRQAHSVVSDSSWISTDLDETSSSCEPSPVHAPRDAEVKVTYFKKGDIPSPANASRDAEVKVTCFKKGDVPSPVHASRDVGVKVTYLKRSDVPQAYSKPKLSRRSSDYETVKNYVGTNNKQTSGVERKECVGFNGEETNPELVRSNSLESRPFRQTAV